MTPWTRSTRRSSPRTSPSGRPSSMWPPTPTSTSARSRRRRDLPHDRPPARARGPALLAGNMIRRAVLAVLLAALAAPALADDAAEKAAIRKVIADMEAAWNRGDFKGYMAGF